MFTIGQLIELALGKDEAKHVDTAIPQYVFDRMTQGQRQGYAGWYYERTGVVQPDGYVKRSLMGRLLAKDECWQEIEHKIKQGRITASILGFENPLLVEWPCFRQHVERGEIQLEEASNG